MPPSSGRKLLHQPFFPTYTSQPPSPPPSPSFPKYPSSTSSSSSSSNPNTPPFFPLYPSPPPPSLPTFPANISSLIATHSHNAPHSSRLIPIISLPILAFALLCLIAAIFLVRRSRSSDRRRGKTEPGSDCHRLVPPNATSSSSPATSSAKAATSEFLYLGTLVSSRGHVSPSGPSGEVGPASAAADSPELRPLPPLSRQVCRSSSSDEEFYSPVRDAKCGSPRCKDEEGGSANFEDPSEVGPPPPRRRAPPPPPPPPVPTLRPPVLKPPRMMGAVKDGNVEQLDGEERTAEERRPKLKPLHWDKVRASSERAMVWDQLKQSSFQLNEEMIETLFGCDSAAKGMENVRRQMGLSPVQENVVLDPKKSQNIAILLRARNVTKEEVCEALLEGNADGLGNELLETLLKMAPSKEEEIKLRECRDDSPSKLGPAEKFLKAMLDIPYAFKRVDAMLYISNFESEIQYLKKSFETLELACEELKSSRLFRKLLDAVLKTGNRMNIGTNRGDAQAFKLDTLLKLVDIKGTDGKTTLLHFVVQEISGAEDFRAKSQSNTLHDDLECKRLGLRNVSSLGSELINVKKAATMDAEILSSYVSKLAVGVRKIREVVRLNECNEHFHEAMITFLKTAEGEITKLQSQEGITLSLVNEITEYFHGDLAKEEAHPFRIFMVVGDFIAILDQVCKDVARVNERSVVSATRKFSATSSPGKSSVFPQIIALQHFGSSDDESSSLSSMSS